MLLNVNATRMEQLQLRRRLDLARRGHRLLSQKRDEISRRLIQITGAILPLRQRVERELLETTRRFLMARATMEPEDLRAALAIPTKQFQLVVQSAGIMSVKVPQLVKEMTGEILCYGYATTSGELDVALRALERAFDGLIELAEKEKQAMLLATELQKTRRRVNVLEHVVIPNLQETIRFIAAKLGEAERDNASRLMKIAEMIRA